MKGRRVTKNSNRIKLSLKYKVAKKVRDHARKIKRDKKRHPERYPKKKSDPGVPNTVPFKMALIEEARKSKEQEELRRKNYLSEVAKKPKELKINSKVSENLKISAEPIMDTLNNNPEDFKLIVEASDIILQILDARDPEGSRCTILEKIIKSCPNKELIFVLNKSNCVPRTILFGWLKYLRSLYPTYPIITDFRSDTPTNSTREQMWQINKDKCIGTTSLMSAINNCFKCRSKTSDKIVVGIVGVSRVGIENVMGNLQIFSNKSDAPSTQEQEICLPTIALNANICMLTSPGIIVPKLNCDDEYFHLRNSLIQKYIDEPIKAVEDILRRSNKMKLMLHYNIPTFTSVEEFLSNIKHKKKRYNLKDTAISIVLAWNLGKMCYYTDVPNGFKCSTDLEDITDEINLLHFIKLSEGISALPLKPIHVVKKYIEEKEESSDQSSEEDEILNEKQRKHEDECPQLVPVMSENHSTKLKRKSSSLELLEPIKKRSSEKICDNDDQYDFNDFYSK